ncbi:MAG: type III secretion system chaperone [Deltaproteobacteria bacterium]|nr:type III secretion system chaperone [Deltaproteobacteria bacterium]
MESVFTGLIQALSGQVKAKLEIRNNNKVHVNFDDIALLIEHLPDAEQLLLAAPVAEVPVAGREELYRLLLQGQHIFAETGGATLALDQEESFVSLQMAPSLRALTRENFPALVENFLNMVDYWRTRCLEITEGETPGETPPEPAPDTGMLRI